MKGAEQWDSLIYYLAQMMTEIAKPENKKLVLAPKRLENNGIKYTDKNVDNPFKDDNLHKKTIIRYYKRN